MTIRTQLLEGNIPFLWAQLTRVSPAFSWHLAAATPSLGGVEGLRDRTLPIVKTSEAEALASVKAPSSIIRQHKARRADTLEAARSIGARPEETDVGLLLTFVDIDAVVVLYFIPRGANTAEGALQVLAGAGGAGPRQAHALIDVYTVLPVRGPVITLLAQALEGADAIDALTISTYLPHQGGTLINVHAVIVVC